VPAPLMTVAAPSADPTAPMLPRAATPARAKKVTSLDDAHKHRRRESDDDGDLSQALEAARDGLDTLERQIAQRGRPRPPSDPG
jgi:hypothetical protein